MVTQKCTDCSAVLPHNPKRKGTRCRSCAARHMARSPAQRAACKRSMERRWADPAERERLCAAMDGTKQAWLPPEYRAEYRRLRSRFKYTTAEARRMIEQQIAADQAREREESEPIETSSFMRILA